MCPYRDYVEAGGLMAYAVDLAELLSRMADNVDQILKGAKPGDIPQMVDVCVSITEVIDFAAALQARRSRSWRGSEIAILG
jgi:putative ABC transport system substrate-binding protein